MKIDEDTKLRISKLLEANKEVMPDKRFFLRVTAVPGGCSGIKHQVYFDYETRLNDNIIRFKEFDIRIDTQSFQLLQGSKIEYVDNREEKGFVIDNPNADGICSCGNDC